MDRSPVQQVPTLNDLGIITMCQGFLYNFGQIVALRFILGLFEAGVFPGETSLRIRNIVNTTGLLIPIQVVCTSWRCIIHALSSSGDSECFSPRPRWLVPLGA